MSFVIRMLAAGPTAFEPSARQVLMLAGLLGILGLLLWRARRRDAGPSPRQYRREIDAATRDERQVRDELKEVMRELDALSGRIARQVDDALARIQQATAEADRRITQLRQPTAAPRAEPSPSGESALDPLPPVTSVTAPSLTPSPGEAATGGSPGSPPSTPADARLAVVYALSDAGLSATDIARQTGRQAGEVELILNLRRAAAESRSTA